MAHYRVVGIVTTGLSFWFMGVVQEGGDAHKPDLRSQTSLLTQICNMPVLAMWRRSQVRRSKISVISSFQKFLVRAQGGLGVCCFVLKFFRLWHGNCCCAASFLVAVESAGTCLNEPMRRMEHCARLPADCGVAIFHPIFKVDQ